MTAAKRLAAIRAICRTAAADYGERPSGREWRMDNSELREIYRLTTPAKTRRRNAAGRKR